MASGKIILSQTHENDMLVEKNCLVN